MITTETLGIYRRFAGDADLALRSGVDVSEWNSIDSLLDDLWNLKCGQASPAFAQEVRESVGLHAADADAALMLWEMALPPDITPELERPWWRLEL